MTKCVFSNKIFTSSRLKSNQIEIYILRLGKLDRVIIITFSLTFALIFTSYEKMNR